MKVLFFFIFAPALAGAQEEAKKKSEEKLEIRKPLPSYLRNYDPAAVFEEVKKELLEEPKAQPSKKKS